MQRSTLNQRFVEPSIDNVRLVGDEVLAELKKSLAAALRLQMAKYRSDILRRTSFGEVVFGQMARAIEILNHLDASLRDERQIECVACIAIEATDQQPQLGDAELR